MIAWAVVAALAALAVPSIRRKFVVEPAFALVQKILPKVSDTEAQALDAGTVGACATLNRSIRSASSGFLSSRKKCAKSLISKI